MPTRKLSALLLLCCIAAIPFLGSCKSTVTNPPACALSPASLNFGTVSVGTTADRTFSVRNSGGGTLSGTVAVVCAQYSLVGSGSYSLAAGDSARFTVRFAPTAIGVKLCSVSTGCDSVHVTGTGAISATPVCTVTPSALNFSTVTVGQTADRTFTITNVGGGTLAGTATTGECGAFSLVGSASYSLGTNETKVITVRFAPASAGALSCSINPGTGCPAVAATGTGQPAPLCQVSTTSMDFGSVTVGQNSDKTFTITNAGGGTLTGSVSTSGCVGFSVVGDASYTLTASQSKTFTIRFSPASPGKPAASRPSEWRRVHPFNTGISTCTVNTGCASISASGTGIVASACQVSPTSLAFGGVTVGQTSDKTFVLTNTGGGTLSGTVSTGGCAGFSIVGDATYSLAGSQTKTFTVRYAPTATGAQTCNINVGAGCSTVNASGTGQLAPACQVSTTTLAFGSVTVGQSADRTFIITNSGGGTLSGTVATSGCTGYSVVGDATYSLTASQSKTFTIRFAPTSAGKPAEPQLMRQLRRWIGRPQDVGVQNCTVTTGCTASVSASGTGVAGASCAVSPTTLAFGSVTVGQTSDRTFTITNNGSSAISGTVTESCASFSIVGTATYNLGAGQSATFTIRFAPTNSTTQNCTISTGGTCSSVAASGTGTTSVTCSPGASTSYYGTWLMVDSTYKCDGTLQLIQRDTIIFCELTPAGGGTDSGSVGDTTTTVHCSITRCTSTQLEETCSGFSAAAGCSTSFNFVIRETFAPNKIDLLVTTNVTYSGGCFGLPNSCTIAGIHYTKISNDTTGCGRIRTGGGNNLNMACKINGAAWSGSGTALVAGVSGTNIVSLYADRASDTSAVNLGITTTSSLTAKTYTSATGASAYYSRDSNLYFGDAGTQISITTLTPSTLSIGGTFHFAGPALGGGDPVNVTEGTFSGTYIVSGSPTIGSPRWLWNHIARNRR